ncbi:thioesterase II family protein [Streptomyces sp. NPDC048111]|uniref:thioesterase II family protein n=1 Tax=Streptomyces sp. NPDC048111 TaxID=3365500 RepID=UPI003723E97A
MSGPRQRERHWLRALADSDDAHTTLVCLPYAGGTPRIYDGWLPHLPDGVRLLAADLPGHGFLRGDEAVCDDLAYVTGRLCAELPAPERAGRLVLFGYSLGGCLAHALAHAWRERWGRAPYALAVAALDAPWAPRALPYFAGLPADELWSRVGAFGAIPEPLLAHRELAPLLVRALRADIAMAEGYQPKAPPLECRVSVFGWSGDPLTTRPGLAAWSAEAAPGAHREHLYADPPGGHFFAERDPGPVVAALFADLATPAPARPLRPTSSTV